MGRSERMRRLDGAPSVASRGRVGSLANVNGGLSAAEDFRLTIDDRLPRDHMTGLGFKACKRRDTNLGELGGSQGTSYFGFGEAWKGLRRSTKQNICIRHAFRALILLVNG